MSTTTVIGAGIADLSCAFGPGNGAVDLGALEWTATPGGTSIDELPRACRGGRQRGPAGSRALDTPGAST